ncbi:MAG: HAD family phosphatase [Alkalibacterium sp.]|nr:HAD family phosphatase [Alkalibacterium sp.]
MKAVILDMDGVIVDSAPLHQKVEADLLEELGGSMTREEKEAFVGTTDYHLWSTLKERYGLEPSVEEMIQMKKKRFLGEIHTISLVDGFEKVLNSLTKKGYLIALASSNNRKAVDKIVEQFQLDSYLETTMSGEDVKNGKPNPEIFLKTAAIMKVDPKECLVIEDAKNGVEAAKRAGMKCIGFDNPSSGKQDLSKADIVLKSYEGFDLDEVEKLFESEE